MIRWHGVILLAATLAGCHRRSDPMPEEPPARAALPDTGAVHAKMRHVNYHVAPGIVMRVERLRGALRPVAGAPASFDDPRSFVLHIDNAAISLEWDDLGRLLNDFVFNYDGSSLSDIEVRPEGGKLRQSGTVHKLLPIPFSILADVSVTDSGLIRLHPVSIRIVGLPAGGLLDFLGVELDGVIRNNRAHGVRVDGDDLLLDPAGLLPPPRLEGRLTGLTLGSSALLQTFGAPDTVPPHAPAGTPDSLASYMLFEGGTLRFGKLTMRSADMLVVDEDQSNWFDFFLDRYREQLVAGYHRTTADDGLVVYMPDYEGSEERD